MYHEPQRPEIAQYTENKVHTQPFHFQRSINAVPSHQEQRTSFSIYFGALRGRKIIKSRKIMVFRVWTWMIAIKWHLALPDSTKRRPGLVHVSTQWLRLRSDLVPEHGARVRFLMGTNVNTRQNSGTVSVPEYKVSTLYSGTETGTDSPCAHVFR